MDWRNSMGIHNKLLCFILVILFSITHSLVFAEEAPIYLMDFYNVDIILANGEEIYEDELYEGYEIEVGSSIRTIEGGYAELELNDSTIIKIDEMTSFTVDELIAGGSGDKNIFTLTTGKFRAVVASIAGKENYQFNGYSSVCGVRGTDLGMVVDKVNNIDTAFVLDGVINYTNSATGQTLELTKDMMANTFDPVFSAIAISRELRNQIDSGLDFKKLKPAEVKSGGDRTKETEGDKETKSGDEKDDTSGVDTAIDSGKTGESDTESDTDTGEEPEAESEIPEWLQELLGMEIGSIIIGDETYAKAVLQPTIALGSLKTALYLPIIYQENMFDTDNWYRPNGNDEWSFGTDQEEPLDIAGDFFSDLFLKIKYLQWGEQRDDFWIKIGNMNDFTIGHGLIMRNYANDSEFPAIRRLGLNLGMDFEKAGFEFISNDISEIIDSPRIIGARGFVRPVGSLALGLSLIADINPGADLPAETGGVLPTAEEIGDPMFFNIGLDVEQPIVESGILSLVLFADLAGMIPWFRSDGSGTYADITSGPHFEAMFPDDPDSFLRNYGFSTGIFGNVLFIDYIADFRIFSGTFRPQFFDTTYDTSSSNYALQTANYIKDPDLDEWDNFTMGIYLEGGYTMEKIFSIEIGYMFPMTMDSVEGFQFLEGEDTLHAKFTLQSDVIPVVDISGSISYDRSYFYKMVAGETSPTGKILDWFDEYTSLNGEIIYAVSDNLDLVYLFSTTVARDPETGEVVYEEDGMTMQIDFSMGIETRIHY
jgi:hypothetical protein